MINSTALSKQSLFDIAIQHGGATDAIFDIARRNNISITSALTSGQQIEVEAQVNAAVVNYYNQNGIAPATDNDSNFYVVENYEQNYIEIYEQQQ